MGRPVNKKFFGPLDDGTNLTINVQVGTNNESQVGYIIRQRSSNKFLVNDGSDNISVCTLVDKADGDLGENEMSIMGYVAGGSQVRLKKFYNRTCRDFNNVRYKWEVQNDSTASLIVLTAI